MKQLVSFLCCLGGLLPFFGRAQCPLTCSNATFGIDVTGVFLDQTGDPCVLELQVINNSTQFSVLQSLVVFINATCTDCPEVTAGNTGIWTITTGFPCGTEGAAYTLFPLIRGLCNNNSTCPLTGVALPVEWLSFRGFSENSDVRLEWTVASEVNNEGFEVQRSADAVVWDPVDFVAGRGTTLEQQLYTYVDERPLPGLNYYRLKQVDLNGDFAYSDMLSVSAETNRKVFRLFPNPASSSLTLEVAGGIEGRAYFRLVNLSGHIVKESVFTQSERAAYLPIDVHDLPAGLYIVEVRTGGQQWRERLIIR